MVDIDQIRVAQCQRLLAGLKAWDDAKSELEIAIAIAAAREKEFRELSEDVRRNIDALDLILELATRSGGSLPATKNASSDGSGPRRIQSEGAPEDAALPAGMVFRSSSRSLFPNLRKSA